MRKSAAVGPARTVPVRHWRSYGDHPLPSGAQALDEPLRAFPSWFLRIVCDRCGKERMVNETTWRRASIPGASRPVRRVVLIERTDR
jgi:hypothetical protein